MKRTILALALVAFACPAFAQFALNVGYGNESFISYRTGDRRVDSYNGVFVGATYTFAFEYFELTPGIYWNYAEQKGVTVPKYTADGKWIWHNIDIPVMFSYTFNKYGNVKPFICAGPVIQIGLSNKIVDAQTSTSLDLYREDNYSLAPGGAFRRFNVLAGPGAGVVIFDRIRINVGYNFGLVRRTKNQAADEPYRNNQFYAGVSLLF